ncbi:MAG: hypothetical protein LBT80_01255 [Lactobacillaceae bacterium]|jgi:capsular polysaccharide biosynthesis protein|nr:hypothetical protein [Lactobacillaceae bacterium]
MDQVIDIRDFLRIAKKNAVIIIGLAIILGGAGFGYSKFMTPKEYSSQSALLVTTNKANSVETTLAGMQVNTNVITTYKDVIIRPAILDSVVSKLADKYAYNYTWHDIAGMISVNNEKDSQVFTLNVNNTNPVVAARINNTVTNVFKQKIGSIMPVQKVTILQKAEEPKYFFGTNTKFTTFVGLMIGLFIGYLFGMIRYIFDPTVKNTYYVTETLGIFNLGEIKYLGKKDVAKIKSAK